MNREPHFSEIGKMSKQAWFEINGVDWQEAEKILALYDTYKRSYGSQESEHHIYPISRGGADISSNRKTLKQKAHTDHHRVFDNMTPREQLIHMVRFNSPVIKRVVKRQLFSILDDDITISGIS